MKKIINNDNSKFNVISNKKVEYCANLASNEIMLNRIFNGSRLEFPFFNYLN